MNYCPSQDWDRYCQTEDLNCSACGANEDRQIDCDGCGGAGVCLDCGYCPDCDQDRTFSILPENYFWRTCSHCKTSMHWQDISIFSDAISGEPTPVHHHCKADAMVKDKQQYEDYEAVMKDVY